MSGTTPWSVVARPDGWLVGRGVSVVRVSVSHPCACRSYRWGVGGHSMEHRAARRPRRCRRGLYEVAAAALASTRLIASTRSDVAVERWTRAVHGRRTLLEGQRPSPLDRQSRTHEPSAIGRRVGLSPPCTDQQPSLEQVRCPSLSARERDCRRLPWGVPVHLFLGRRLSVAQRGRRRGPSW